MVGRLIVSPSAAEALARHLADAYPREGCGVLLGAGGGGGVGGKPGAGEGPDDGGGPRGGDVRRAARAEPATNRREDRPDRYDLDPDVLRRLLEEEEEGGPRVLGFYHSHPDAAPVPSETDRAHAWPWYVYLIVPVPDGRPLPGEARAWRLVEEGAGGSDARRFREVGLEVEAGGRPGPGAP